jgi:hypothetical protein
MSILNFSREEYVKSIDTGELIRCGSFRVNQASELAAIRSFIYIRGTLGGNERMRAKFFLDDACTILQYTSAWTAKISSAVSGDWLGWIRIDFNNENLNPNITYYLAVELDGYTRDTEVFYIGLCRDFPYPIYKITPAPSRFYRHPQATQIFVRITR